MVRVIPFWIKILMVEKGTNGSKGNGNIRQAQERLELTKQRMEDDNMSN
jgi:hypothetical protein